MSYGGKSLPGLPRAALCWTPGLAPAPNVLAPQVLRFWHTLLVASGSRSLLPTKTSRPDWKEALRILVQLWLRTSNNDGINSARVLMLHYGKLAFPLAFRPRTQPPVQVLSTGLRILRQLLPFQHDQADRVVRGDEETWAVLHVGRESVAEIRLTQESLMDGWSDEDRCGIEEWDDRGNSLRGELRIEWRRKPSGPRLASIGKSVEVEVWFLWAKGEASCLRVRGMPGATTFQLRNAIDKRFGRNVEGGWGNRAGDSPGARLMLVQTACSAAPKLRSLMKGTTVEMPTTTIGGTAKSKLVRGWSAEDVAGRGSAEICVHVVGQRNLAIHTQLIVLMRTNSPGEVAGGREAGPVPVTDSKDGFSFEEAVEVLPPSLRRAWINVGEPGMVDFSGMVQGHAGESIRNVVFRACPNVSDFEASVFKVFAGAGIGRELDDGDEGFPVAGGEEEWLWVERGGPGSDRSWRESVGTQLEVGLREWLESEQLAGPGLGRAPREWCGAGAEVRGNGVTRERWGQRLREALQREARGGRAGLVAIEGLPTWDPPQQLEFSAQWADGVVALGSQGGQVAVARWEPHSSRSGGNWRPAGLAEEATGGPVIGLDWVRSSPGVLLTAWSGAGSGPDEAGGGAVLRWRHEEGRLDCVGAFPTRLMGVTGCASDMFGAIALLAGGSTVCLIDVDRLETVGHFRAAPDGDICNAPVFASLHPHLIAAPAFLGRAALMFDTRSALDRPVWRLETPSALTNVCFSPDDRTLLISGVDNWVSEVCVTAGHLHDPPLELPHLDLPLNYTKSYYTSAHGSSPCSQHPAVKFAAIQK